MPVPAALDGSARLPCRFASRRPCHINSRHSGTRTRFRAEGQAEDYWITPPDVLVHVCVRAAE